MKETKQDWTQLRNISLLFAALGVAFSIMMWSVTGPNMHTTNTVMSIVMAVPVIGLGWIGWVSHKRSLDFDA
jgi:hypothetical protein